MKHFHPKKNDKGQSVELKHPSQPSNPDEWMNSMGPFTVVPEGEVPAEISGISTESWNDVPENNAGWEKLAETASFDEPAFKAKPGKKPASGAVIIESDGQVWVVSPSNQFAGYVNTFPKGTIEAGSQLSLRANAIKEVYEETGLNVKLTGFLADSDRTKTTTRYYLARRVGGNPADMGWESQADHLVPRYLLPSFVTHENDAVVLAELKQKTPVVMKSDILREQALTSIYPILKTVDGFKKQHGIWPTRLLLDTSMAEAIPRYVLTPLGWNLLQAKLEVISVENGAGLAEYRPTTKSYHSGKSSPLISEVRADIWIWGLNLYD